MPKRSVYITGLSCRFPESDSPNEFFQNLLSKRDLVTADTRRWKEKIDDLPERFGKLKRNLDLFDNKFFTVHGKQAERLDPQLRLLLEISYEALVDAGLSLSEVKETKTGVYIGGCYSDAHKGWLQNREKITGYEHTGCTTSMLANRLSFFFDLQGPSESIDTACSSSLVAFHRAVQDLEEGVCDVALVGGASIILWPHTSYAFHKLKMLSPDGACKSFDQAANGFARAEGVSVVVLSTKKNSKYRPYAKVLGSGVNNGGWNPVGITFPSGKMQKDLYRTVCKKAKIAPKEIDYIEAHGTGTVAGDGEELGAIYEVYGKENPNLYIGSVKSNMGHCEGGSGLAGMIKTLLSMDQETLAPNIHLHNPNEKLQHMRVATDPLSSWKPNKAAVSSFGFGGTNAHVVLENCSDLKETARERKLDLTLLAHRTKEGLYALKKVCPKGMEIPNRENKQKISFREVLELPDDPEVGNISDSPDKIFIACSGNGSQWKGMGVKLYREFPVFKKAIDSCGKALKVDLFSMLERGCSDALENTIGLVAIQIGLVELLKTMGVSNEKIDGYFGHSAGEILCSYLDGITTLGETMEIAYARGFNANQTGDRGCMASIGLSREKMEEFIRKHGNEERVCIACVNSPRNVTISGYKEDVLALAEIAEKEDVFSRPLETYGKAYHSFFFAERRAELEKMLKERLGVKKRKRSGKWTSSIASFDSETFDYQYHVNGVVRPVDFVRALEKIPQNSTVLEIGPHSVLKNLIKDNRPDLKYACLMKRDTDELEALREGLGKLWKLGIDLELAEGETVFAKRPSLEVREKLVSWDHSDVFPIPRESDFKTQNGGEQKVVYNLAQEKDAYLKGHVIDGKILLPATSYLCAMWDVFRKERNLSLSDSVNYSISDFEILQAVQVEGDSAVELNVSHLGAQYELRFKDEVVAKAKIALNPNRKWTFEYDASIEKELPIDANNFYRIVGSAGYEYSGDFRVVETLRSSFERNSNFGSIRWTGNWIAFLDGALQCQLLGPRTHLEDLRVPVRIRSIEINPQLFAEGAKGGKALAVADFDTGMVSMAGIEVANMETKILARKKRDSLSFDVKQEASFLPFGKSVYEDPVFAGYGRFITNYAIHLCSRLIIEENLGDRGHYRRILEAFQRWKLRYPVDEKETAHYRNLPECVAVRILDSNYSSNAREFLEKPLMATTQHPEYNRFYFDDPTAAIHDRSAIEKYLSVVRDNVNRPDLRILEIGTGTGGFTRLIAPHLANDQYIATDITETLQLGPIERLKPHYEKFNLNEEGDFSLLGKHSVDLVVASNSLHTGSNIERVLKSLHDALNDGSFLILYEFTSPAALALFGMESRLWSFDDEREFGLWLSQESWIDKLQRCGFQVVSYSSDKNDISTLFLVRKAPRIALERMEAPSIDQFALWHGKIQGRSRPTLLVSKGIESSGVTGFIRTLNKEAEESCFYCLAAEGDVPQETFDQIGRCGLRINLVRDGKLGTVCYSKIRKEPLDPGTGWSTRFTALGDFSSYEWRANPLPREDFVCEAKYIALNFKDVMLLTGKVTRDAFAGFGRKGYIGIEFSGTGPDGLPYMGYTKGLTTHVDACKDRVIPVPPQLSLEEAATIPVVYGTVYYALFDRAHIQPGQTVLIHAAAGGVGQAALRVCAALGCRVFATCHSSKRGLVKELFPELDDASILDSRSVDFEREILKRTGGRGVDIVLNSLADDKLQASLRCVARDGYFLEIGKYDIMRHSALDMHLLIKNATICGVDLDQVMERKEGARRMFDQIEEGLRQGVVKPLPRRIFHHTEMDEAFRFMAAGKHTGKVLIDVEGVSPKTSRAPFRTPYYRREKETGYCLITGGLGGFGMTLMKWLFERGVEKFLVTSRKGISTGEQKRTVDLLRSEGAEIIVSTADVAKKEEAERLIGSVEAKIHSIFHLAMVLEDVLFKNMTKEKWEAAVRIKAMGAIHLDRLTRGIKLKHFVVFSSATSRYGSIGQCSYAFANSTMEEVCRLRAKEGLPALAIQWGAIGNVGFVANHAEELTRLRNDYEAIHIEEAIQFLDDALSHRIGSDCILYSSHRLNQVVEQTVKITSAEAIGQICNAIKMDLRKCNPNETLEVLGVDSLQVVEIQTILIKSILEVLPLKKISSMKIGELIEMIETKLGRGADGLEPSERISRSEPGGESLITVANRVEGNSEVIYLFLGLGVDLAHARIARTDRFNIHVVLWQGAESVESIAEAVQNDVRKNDFKKVMFLSHSAGYQIAKAVLMQRSVPVDRFCSISLVGESMIQNMLTVEKLENVPEPLFQEAYRSSAFFYEKHLPIGQVKRQSVLLSKVLGHPYLPPHLVMNPKGDAICDRTKGGIEIGGTHHADSLDMKEIYARL